MNDRREIGEALSKVPAITFGFWIIKTLATTLGETGGDTVSMTWLGETTPEAGQAGLNGYLVATAFFGVALVVLVWAQIRPAGSIRGYTGQPSWLRRLAARPSPTSAPDPSGLAIQAAPCSCSPASSRRYLPGTGRLGRSTSTPSPSRSPRPSTGLRSPFPRRSVRRSATGSPNLGLGYGAGALVFGAGLAVLAALYFTTSVSRVALFWAALILTRPLGATVGDFLDKPLDKGGLALSRPLASGVLAIAIIVLILVIPQRPGGHPSRAGQTC